MREQSLPRISVQYFLNHDLDAKEVEKQIELMADAGVECVLLHPRQGLKTPWLSKKWDDITRLIYRTAKRTGMRVAIWDDCPFPSGNAGGLIVANNPEYAGRCLKFSVLPIETGKHIYSSLNQDSPDELGRLVGGYIVSKDEITDATHLCGILDEGIDLVPRQVAHHDYQDSISPYQNPHFRWGYTEHRYGMHLEDPHAYAGASVVIAIEYKNCMPQCFIQNDLLNKDAVRAFVETTYAHYDQIASEESILPAFAFTDEPGPYGDYSWTPAFFEEFERDHGYSLREVLPHIAMDIDQSSTRVRVDYRKTLGRLYAENYLGTISEWCREKGIPLGGHLPRLEMIGECVNVPHRFRAHEYMDIPTHDPLGDNVSKKDLVLRTLAIKVAASAARLFGKKNVMSDSFALLPESTSMRELKISADWQMFAGINCFSIHNFSYSVAGPRKDEAPPSYFYHQPWFSDMRCLLEYMKSTSSYVQAADFPADTAILLPDTSVMAFSNSDEAHQNRMHRVGISRMCTDVGEILLDNRAMFDFLDEQAILDAVLEKGRLSSSQQFTRIILPSLDYIEAATASKLEEASKAGVDVICVEKKPLVLPEKPGLPPYEWNTAEMRVVSLVDLGDVTTETFEISGEGQEYIWASRIKNDVTEGVYLYNTSNEVFRGRIRGGLNVELYPRSGLLVRDLDAEQIQVASARRKSDVEIDRFHISFGDNTCPLHIWHQMTQTEVDQLSPIPDELLGVKLWLKPAIDLMRNRTTSVIADDMIYISKFLAAGNTQDLRLVIEPLESGEIPEIYVNGKIVSSFSRTADFDVCDYSADISNFVKMGAVPQLNLIKIIVRKGAYCLSDSPVLKGGFEVSFGHGLEGLPTITGHPGTYSDALPASWSSMGRMFYSGSADYECRIDIAESDSDMNCIIYMDSVETLAKVYVDGAFVACRYHPPYLVNLGKLSAGRHDILLRITNTLANRVRGQWRNSGLLSCIKFRFEDIGRSDEDYIICPTLSFVSAEVSEIVRSSR